MPVKKEKFRRVATRKGFVEMRSGDHIYYRFVQPDGKQSPWVTTKISHGGNKDISDVLLAKMSRQMKFEKKADLIDFIECTFSADDYCDLLVSKKFMK